jgi:hypothetical protein
MDGAEQAEMTASTIGTASAVNALFIRIVLRWLT